LQPTQPGSGFAPLSQVSNPATIPSPHIAATHASPAVGQTQPDSRWQVAEQPSSGVVLPSSQVSVPSILPLPHVTICTQSCPWRRAREVGLDLAGVRASVEGRGVAVVAGLGRRDDAVAAAGRRDVGVGPSSRRCVGLTAATAVDVGAVVVVSARCDEEHDES
jgi:hypothetical protein